MKYEIRELEADWHELVVTHDNGAPYGRYPASMHRGAFVHRLLDVVKSTAEDLYGIADEAEILSALDDLATLSALVASFIRDRR